MSSITGLMEALEEIVTSGGPPPGSATPTPISTTTGSPGDALAYARENHKHQAPVASATEEGMVKLAEGGAMPWLPGGLPIADIEAGLESHIEETTGAHGGIVAQGAGGDTGGIGVWSSPDSMGGDSRLKWITPSGIADVTSVSVDFGATIVDSSYGSAPTWTPGVLTLPFVGMSGDAYVFRLDTIDGAFTKRASFSWDPILESGYASCATFETANPGPSTCWINWETDPGTYEGTWDSGYSSSAVINGSTWSDSVEVSVASYTDGRLEIGPNAGLRLLDHAGTGRRMVTADAEGDHEPVPQIIWTAATSSLSLEDTSATSDVRFWVKNFNPTHGAHYYALNDVSVGIQMASQGTTAAGSAFGQTRAGASELIAYSSPTKVLVGSAATGTWYFGIGANEEANMAAGGWTFRQQITTTAHAGTGQRMLTCDTNGRQIAVQQATWTTSVLALVDSVAGSNVAVTVRNTDASRGAHFYALNAANVGIAMASLGASASGSVFGQTRAGACELIAYTSPTKVLIGSATAGAWYFGIGSNEEARMETTGWTFRQAVKVGTDPGGSELVRVGGAGRFNGALVLAGTLTGVTSITASGTLTDTIADAATNTVVYPVVVGHNSSATPVAGFGTGIWLQGKSSTTNDAGLGRVQGSWIDATHASRKGRVSLLAGDAGGYREGLRVDSDGSLAHVVVLNSLVIGTDPGGSEPFRVGGAGRFSGDVSTTGGHFLGQRNVTSVVLAGGTGSSSGANVQLTGPGAGTVQGDLRITGTAVLSWSSGLVSIAGLCVVGADPGGSEPLRVGGAARMAGDMIATLSTNGAVESVVTNANTGASALARSRWVADVAQMQARSWSSTGAGTSFGVSRNSLNELITSNGNGLVIGNVSIDKPIVFGVNVSEVGRFTGGTLATDSFQVKYTGATAIDCAGGGRFAGKITTVSAVPGSFTTLADVQTWLAANFT